MNNSNWRDNILAVDQEGNLITDIPDFVRGNGYFDRECEEIVDEIDLGDGEKLTITKQDEVEIALMAHLEQFPSDVQDKSVQNVLKFSL